MEASDRNKTDSIIHCNNDNNNNNNNSNSNDSNSNDSNNSNSNDSNNDSSNDSNTNNNNNMSNTNNTSNNMSNNNNNNNNNSSSSANQSTSPKTKRNKRKSNVRPFSELPPEVAQHFLSQMSGAAGVAAAAAAWDNRPTLQQKDGATFGGSSLPPTGTHEQEHAFPQSFGPLDLAALAQSGKLGSAIDFAQKGKAGPNGDSGSGPPCSEAEMKALMSMFVEIMGMSMDNPTGTNTPDNTNSGNPSSSPSTTQTKQTVTQAARNFLQSANSSNSNTTVTTSATSSGGGSYPVFMFGDSNGSAGGTVPAPPGGWPSSSAAAAAAAVAARINGFSHDCYETHTDDEEDDSLPDLSDAARSSRHAIISSLSATDKELPQPQNDIFSPAAALAALEQADLDNALQEEEVARKAAKKREKKQRKKEKAKKEAALKGAQAAQKKREKLILSWRSRVVSACQANEVSKLESLLSESPLRQPPATKSSQHYTHTNTNTAHSTTTNRQDCGSDDDDTSHAQEEAAQNLKSHLEFLLPNCIAKTRQQVESGQKARQKLADFILDNAMPAVFFSTGRSGRTALHTACFTGDTLFLKFLLDRLSKSSGQIATLPESYLNMTCEDSGWSPLHYAVASGTNDTIEVLLEYGCDVHQRTDAGKTCRVSGDGVTALELVEIFRTGKPEKALETQGDALQEVTDNYLDHSTERSRFMRLMEKITDRLTDVEQNGYSRVKDPLGSLTKDSETKEEVSRRAATSLEDAAKKKKKKKKKKTQQQIAEPGNMSAPKPVPISAIFEKQEDPMISALLGMGFSREQISAAAKACGGTNRATADDLVMWIFSQEGGGTEVAAVESAAVAPSTVDDATLEAADFIDPNSVEGEQNLSNKQQDQRELAAAHVQKGMMEAASRAEEERLATQRLTAKKEEQRRRNREWNNREVNRQKEETEAKLAQEMQRRARAEQQRMMGEHMAAQQLLGAPQGMVGVPQQISYTANVQTVAAGGGQHHTSSVHPNPKIGATHILQSNGEVRSLQGGFIPSGYSNNEHQIQVPGQTGLHPQAEFNIQVPPIGGAPQMTIDARAPGCNDAFDGQPRNISNAHGEMQPPATVDVSTFQQFPMRGKAEQEALLRSMTAEDGTVSSMGSSMQRESRTAQNTYKSRNGPCTPKGRRGANPPSSSYTPPPGFLLTGPSTSSPPDTAAMLMQQQQQTMQEVVSEEPNHLGEIRATAKAFVPTNFKPSAVPSSTPQHQNTNGGYASAPTPGEFLADPSVVSEKRSWMGGLGMDQAEVATSSSLLNPSSSLLPAGLAPSRFGSAGQHSHSPIPSEMSSMTGAPKSSDNLDPFSAVGGSSSGVGVGMDIWGGSGAAAPTLPFSFGEATSSLAREPALRTFGTIESIFDDGNKNETAGGDSWGSGDILGGVGGGGNATSKNTGLGSIW